MKTEISNAEKAVQYLLSTHGPMPAARCSSAKAQGNAKKYSYWGAAEYVLRTGKAGYPIAVCVSGASSDRRSTRLAKQDTRELAERLGGMVISSIGRLNGYDLDQVWMRMDPIGYGLHVQREAAREGKKPSDLADRLKAYKLGRMDYQPYGDERDAQVFRKETNAERRHRIWQACGPRIAEALHLTEIQRDDFGILYRASVVQDSWRTELLVKVVNATPEPDGSYKDYFLRVPGDMATAKQAVAWTFGVLAEEYQPQLQS